MITNKFLLNTICHQVATWCQTTAPQKPNWDGETWDVFKSVCRVHGVAELLHLKLKDTPWLDKAIKNWLAEQYDYNTKRITKIRGELLDILALFAQHNIPTIPIKGALLTNLYYKDMFVRPMADLDLLIPPQHFKPCVRLLAQLGYQIQRSLWKNVEFIKSDNLNVASITCEHPNNPRWVEIHIHCQEMFGGPIVDLTEAMWQQCQPETLYQQPACIIPPDLLWLHLLAHTSGDIWRGKCRLIQLVDLHTVAPLISNKEKILNTVDARFIYFALLLLKKTFPASISDDLLLKTENRLSRQFRAWGKTFNLVNSSHLNPGPKPRYISKVLRFNEGRPQEILTTLQYIFRPNSQALMVTDNHPSLWRVRSQHALRLLKRTFKQGEET